MFIYGSIDQSINQASPATLFQLKDLQYQGASAHKWPEKDPERLLFWLSAVCFHESALNIKYLIDWID